MLTLNGSGRLTRDPELRQTPSGKDVSTVALASDRRDRSLDPLYVNLVLWETQARNAVEHLRQGQHVTFSGRFEPRTYTAGDGAQRVTYDVTNVDLEYGAKARPRSDDDSDD